MVSPDTTAYDPTYSRPISTTRVVDGTSYASSISYDTYGRTAVLTYPTGVKVRQAYNAFGVVKEVRRQIGGAAAASDPIIWMALPDTTTGDGLAESRHLHGNGVVTARLASRATGRVRSIETGVRGTANLQAIDLDYDRAGNVVRRIDEAINLTDTAWYDALNRLTGFTSAQGYVLNDVDVHYGALGNITWKSDVGSYTYGGPRPHAVTATSGGAVTGTFIYDANGNMTSGLGRTINYTAYNQISGISQSGASSTFTFSADRDRIKQVIAGRGTVVYGGALYERFTPTSGLVEHTHYIMTPAGRTASYKTWTGSAVTETRYFHTDHLGSITLVTGEKGGVVQRFRYDPWGKRLGATADPAAWMTLSHANNGGFRRGFTDHEHLEDLGLIHMNGRIFDPVLGRFLSADPNIDGVSDSQGYNRYSYVLNNPLNATDPSGYLSFKDVVKIAAVVAIAYFSAGAAINAWGITAKTVEGVFVVSVNSSCAAALPFSSGVINGIIGGAVGGFASGFSGSLLNGASVGDAFKSGVVGGVVGGVSGGVGGWIDETFNGMSRAAARGAFEGAKNEATGKEFRHGFYTGSFGVLGAPAIQQALPESMLSQTIARAVTGGTSSVIGGGKFANGAVSTSFRYLLDNRSKIAPNFDGKKLVQQAGSFVASAARETAQLAMDLVGKVWASPASAIGLVGGISAIPFGAKVNVGYNAVVFSNVWFMRGGSAITFGNTILTQTSFDELDDDTTPTYYAARWGYVAGIVNKGFSYTHFGRHEQGHTYQYQVLGLFYFVPYLLDHPISWRNDFEDAADAYGARGGRWWPHDTYRKE